MVSSMNASVPPRPPPPPVAAAGTPAHLPPPSTVGNRRPRRGSREVSSRYLSTPRNPIPNPRTPRSGSLSGSESDTESVDENRYPATTSARSTPFTQFKSTSTHSGNTPFYFTSQSKSTNKRVVHKLFAETPNSRGHTVEDSRCRLRPGTPVGSVTRNPVRQKKADRSDDDCSLDVETCSIDSGSTTNNQVLEGGFCESPPLVVGTGSRTVRQSPDVRSSLPESSGRGSNPFCCRSLNSSLSACQPITFNPGKATATDIKRGLTAKPPQHPGGKAVIDLKKGGKKGKRGEEEIHMLKLLNNRYMQLRFVNARAELALKARTTIAERELYGASVKICKLRDKVSEKRAQLNRLKRDEILTSILEPQIPYLDEWENLERDHSHSLSGVTNSLRDASLRVPIDSTVKADAKEIREVLNYALFYLEPLPSSLQSFVPKVEEIENLSSDLARVVIAEQTLIEECANLLAVAENLQVKECSLRGQLMQI